jgi:hypothetical protein
MKIAKVNQCVDKGEGIVVAKIYFSDNDACQLSFSAESVKQLKQMIVKNAIATKCCYYEIYQNNGHIVTLIERASFKVRSQS